MCRNTQKQCFVRTPRTANGMRLLLFEQYSEHRGKWCPVELPAKSLLPKIARVRILSRFAIAADLRSGQFLEEPFCLEMVAPDREQSREIHQRTLGCSIQNGDRIDLDMNTFHRECNADQSIHRIVIAEELMVDLDLLAFEGVPLVGVGHEHRQLTNIGRLPALGFDHSRQSIKDDSQLFHRATVLGRRAVGSAAGQEKHVSGPNSSGVVRSGRINVFEVNTPFFHGNHLQKELR